MSYASSTTHPADSANAFIQGQNAVGTNFTKTAVGGVPAVSDTDYVTSISLSAGVWAIIPSYNFNSNDSATLLIALEIQVTNASATPYSTSNYYNVTIPDEEAQNFSITQIVNVVDYEVSPIEVSISSVFSGATTPPSLSGVVNCIRIA